MKEILTKYFKGDGVIWGVVILLSLVSLLAVYSSAGSLAYQSQSGSTSYYILKHFTFLIISLLIIFVVHNIPYKYYSRLSQLFLLISIVLLVITLSIGEDINMAKRWLTLPGLGLTIQTSDFAKIALVMYIARILSLKQYKISDSREITTYLFLPTILVCALILPANLSTSLILFTTILILMFIGRVRVSYIAKLLFIGLLLVALFISGIIISGNQSRVNTWKNRIENFVDEDSGENYQIEQAKVAISTGGFIGKGPGNSIQRDFLPYAYSDFIYAVIVEEYGFLGGMVILFLYMFLLYRAGVIVKKSNRSFAAFLAIGLSLLLVFQAIINMAVNVHLLPVTGQTLPLLSMGGSSMIFSSIAIGIILSVSRSADESEKEKNG
ncbi:MAG: FtsW/RodA/SpoVE family cell cycle protein [Bacteroidales bacterium]